MGEAKRRRERGNWPTERETPEERRERQRAESQVAVRPAMNVPQRPVTYVRDERTGELLRADGASAQIRHVTRLLQARALDRAIQAERRER